MSVLDPRRKEQTSLCYINRFLVGLRDVYYRVNTTGLFSIRRRKRVMRIYNSVKFEYVWFFS